MLPFTDDVTAIVKDWFFLEVDCMVIIFGHSELGCLLGIQVETSQERSEGDKHLESMVMLW